VIGRLGWLAAGVVLGVAGYRRVSRLARSISPVARPAGRSRPGAGERRGIQPFVRDVRDGMELYLDRHSGPAGPTLEGQQVAPRLSGRAGVNGDDPGTDNAKDGR
jgi:hypothetical protein